MNQYHKYSWDVVFDSTLTIDTYIAGYNFSLLGDPANFDFQMPVLESESDSIEYAFKNKCAEVLPLATHSP